MSQIVAIFNAVEGLSVSTANIAPVAVDDLDETLQAYEDIHLPRRVLFLSEGRGGSGDQEFIAYGNPMGMEWVIEDVLLYRRLGMGSQASIQGLLAAYVAAYSVVVRNNRGIYANTEITHARYIIGPQEYPRGAGTWFDGIRCILTIREFLTG